MSEEGRCPTGETIVVAVVSYNSAAVLPELIASLGPGLAGSAWQLVVADNDSTDSSVRVVSDLVPDATIVRMGRNAGYAAGLNAAVTAAPPHTAVLVLNPDVRLDEGCVSELLKVLRQPGVGIVVPRLRDRHGDRIDSMRRTPTLLRAWADALLGARRAGRFPRLGEVVMDPTSYDEEVETDWAEGSVQLVSAACWQACGGWDERYFLYSEETDFDLRARDAGFSARFVPRASATHLEGESGVSPRLWPLLVVNRVRFFRQRHGRLSTMAYWGAILVREASRAALGRPPAKAAVRALIDPQRLRTPSGPEWIR
ncbi:MAG: glycosyltransferase family 2 protein [Nocardioides sp.]